MDTAETISKRVIDLVGQWWENRKAPMLLSTLGAMEEGAIATDAKAVSGSLRVFIEQNLADDVVVVQHRTRPTIVGAVPQAVYKAHDEWDASLDKVTNSAASPHRYHPAFWAAFRKPIAESDTRYITVSGPVHFTDLRHGPPPDDMVEVRRELIADSEATDTDVHASIGVWLTESGVAVDRYRDVKATSALPANDVLGKLVQALDADELSQVSIPMPIIAKLRRRPA